jgi:16S rRNA (guanine527-N7)-methyltransferase
VKHIQKDRRNQQMKYLETDEFKKLFSQVDIKINDHQLEQFYKYIDLILTWNKRTNLVSRLDESKIFENHILESLAFLIAFDLSPGAKVIDIGTGAGFPGLPIGLVRSDANFLLVESKRMKTLFLKEVVSQLNLKNIEVIGERVEIMAQNPCYNNKFDFAISRAVGNLEIVYGWIKKLIKSDGLFIAWKGGNVKQEIEQLKKKENKISVNMIPMDERFAPVKKDRLFVCVKRI